MVAHIDREECTLYTLHVRRLFILMVSLSVLSGCGISTGSAESDYKVGMMYLHGIGLTQNYQEGFQWILKSAKAGYSKAEFQLGTLYDAGLGTDKDPSEAYRWFQKAADADIPEAWYNVGNALRSGIGIEQDYRAAIKAYEKAAAMGYGPAAHNLGAMAGNGEGRPQSDTDAYRWLFTAWKLGVKADEGYKERFISSFSKKIKEEIESGVLKTISEAASSDKEQ